MMPFPPMESKMTKPKRTHKAKAASTLKRQSKAAEAKRARQPKSRASSKQVEVIGLLSRSGGTTIAAIMKATGWQQHSVRGFLAGVVRKKLGLKLESDKSDGERIYRIVTAKTSKAKAKAESTEAPVV